MTAHLEWKRTHRADTLSIWELDDILDELTIVGKSKQPFSVDLVHDSGDVLSIVVGGDISSVNFYSPQGHPKVVGCHNSWEEEEEGNQLFVFDCRGSYSEMEKRFTVSIVDAREAMRRFFATGQRPDNITWEP